MPVKALHIIGLFGLFVWLETTPSAQPPTTPFDHVHLAVPNPQDAFQWYVDRFQGSPAEFPGRVSFEPWRPVIPLPVQLLFTRSADARPSEGSTIESIGLSFDGQSGLLSDPWGVKIELVDDARLRGFHHVRLRVPDVEGTMKWYERHFGGRRVVLRGEQALSYGNVYVIVSHGKGAPSRGRAIDHISWGPTDIRGTMAELRSQGQKIVADVTGPNSFGHHIAYAEDPDGIYIELVRHNELLK
jgi:catechol 2,3-dioxygenase-like lactoylglutathione lyase family enzyme